MEKIRLVTIGYTQPKKPGDPPEMFQFDFPLVGECLDRIQIIDTQGEIIFALPVKLIGHFILEQLVVELRNEEKEGL